MPNTTPERQNVIIFLVAANDVDCEHNTCVHNRLIAMTSVYHYHKKRPLSLSIINETWLLEIRGIFNSM